MSDKDESSVCKHPRYNAELKVFYADVTGVNIRQLMIRARVRCAQCKKMYIFKGPTGFSTAEPRCSPDGYELRAPLELPDQEEEEEIENEKKTIN